MPTHAQTREFLARFKAAIQKFAYSIAPTIRRTATAVFDDERHARILGFDEKSLVEIVLHDDVNPPTAVIILCELEQDTCETLAYVLEHNLHIRTHFVPPLPPQTP